VQIDKSAILDMLREKGQQDQANQAEQQLPDQVDTDKNADLLQRLGINPQEILEKFMGRGGIPSL
jgi:predicted PhzF superfamily epimerase YddE/YHI9